ncbi:MAG: sulfatase-like hydrolase/transferase [Bacteroidia bacterium]
MAIPAERRKHTLLNSPAWAVLKVATLFLVSDALLRLVFFIYNCGGGWEYAGGQVPLALLVGIRYDVATLAIFNGLFLILMALPIPALIRRGRLLRWLQVLFHLPVMILNGIDVIYFGFSGKRLSHELFSSTKEAANVSGTDLLQYWWLIIGVFLIAAVHLWLIRKWWRAVQAPEGPWQRKIGHWAFPLVLAGLLFLGLRGGWQVRPMTPAQAFVTGSLFLGNVSLNSAYTVVQSIEIGSEPDVTLMPMQEAVKVARELVKNDFDGPFTSDEYPLLRQTSFPEPERKYNVVLLIVESLNAAKVGSIRGKPLAESLTPNLDTLAERHGILFTNFYSNGSRSVQSLPAILNGTPDLFERPLIGSSYETNQQWGIGNILRDRGYHTSFFCGGPNGTLGFDSFSKVSGFDHYYGPNAFTGNAEMAGKWGLHDHEMLKWLAAEQTHFPEPFASVWFSISNHHPFDRPQDCPKELVSEGMSPMDITVKYSDWALGEYLRDVRRTPWGANTIFAITGDHCFYFDNDPDRGDVQNFHVPLLLVGPGITPAKSDREGSHVSILPTLIELLRLKTSYSGVGVSMLSQSNQPFSLTSVMGILALSKSHLYLSSTLEKVLTCYRYNAGKWDGDQNLGASPEGQQLDHALKAIYQVCHHMRKYNKQNPSR